MLHLIKLKKREMKLFMISFTSVILLFTGCNKNYVDYNEYSNIELFYYADGSTQTNTFEIEYLNDSVYVHKHYELKDKTFKVSKDINGHAIADTFKLNAGVLSLKKQNDYYVLANGNTFWEIKDTFIDIRSDSFNSISYVPKTVYEYRKDSIYVYGMSSYGYDEKFGFGFHPSEGIISYLQGSDTLVIQKIEVNNGIKIQRPNVRSLPQ